MKRTMLWLLIITLLVVFLIAVRSILLPFVVGMLAAFFLDPAADKLERRGVSRSLASFILCGMLFSVLIIGLFFLLPALYDQLLQLFTTLPETLTSLQQKASSLYDEVSGVTGAPPGTAEEVARSIAGSLSGSLSAILKQLLTSGQAAVNVLSLLFITPVVSFYLLRDWDRMIAKLDQLLPRKEAPTIRARMQEIDRALSGFIRGQTNVCLIMAVIYTVGLLVVGLKYAVAVGVLTGLLTFVPYVGFLFGMILGLVSAWLQFHTLAGVMLVFAVFMVGQGIESAIVTPRLVGEKVGLHPLWIIFGLLAGGVLFGFIGVLIAVPLTAIIAVWVRFGVECYKQSELYRDKAKKV